jgi:Tfp pilus assembly protein PilN
MALAMTAPADGFVLQDREVALRERGQVRAVRPISLDALEPQLRRLMATDEAFANAGKGLLTVYDVAGVGDAPYRQAAVQLGMADRLSIQSSTNGSPAAVRHAPAVALTHAEPHWIDFLHPRLAVPPKPRFDRRARVAAMVVVLLLLGGLGFWLTWQQRAATVADLQTQLAAIADQVDDSEKFIAMVKRADGWFGDRPAVLDCMLDLTRAFPLDDRIWARDLTLDADLAGSLTGQARSNQAVLDLREALQRSDQFSGVKLIYMRTATRGDELIAFALGFRFTPARQEVTP